MKCPFCNNEQDKVVDSRASKEGRAVRRRRECLACGKRFTTYEYIETFPLTVVKADQRREPYEREKLLRGIISACKKRPISMKKVESIVDKIEDELNRKAHSEVSANEIGQYVMDELMKIDEVAYVRFASVYRKFSDLGAFVDSVREMETRKTDS